MTDLAKLIDQVHQALRGVDAADQSEKIPAAILDDVAEAVSRVERFARQNGIALSEFAK